LSYSKKQVILGKSEKCLVMAKQLEVIYAQSAELYWLRPNNEIARFVFACCLGDFCYWFAFYVRLLQKLG
jgi:hypothetical protein